jgi:hypothetical protein
VHVEVLEKKMLESGRSKPNHYIISEADLLEAELLGEKIDATRLTPLTKVSGKKHEARSSVKKKKKKKKKVAGTPEGKEEETEEAGKEKAVKPVIKDKTIVKDMVAVQKTVANYVTNVVCTAVRVKEEQEEEKRMQEEKLARECAVRGLAMLAADCVKKATLRSLGRLEDDVGEAVHLCSTPLHIIDERERKHREEIEAAQHRQVASGILLPGLYKDSITTAINRANEGDEVVQNAVLGANDITQSSDYSNNNLLDANSSCNQTDLEE